MSDKYKELREAIANEEWINVMTTDPHLIRTLLAERDALLEALEAAERILAHCKADMGYGKDQTRVAIKINAAIEAAKRQEGV